MAPAHRSNPVVCFRCISCVTSDWGCQWNAQDHSCSDSDDAVHGNHIVKPQQVCYKYGVYVNCVVVLETSTGASKKKISLYWSLYNVVKSDSCPQFESPEPLLIPVGYEIPISFQGRNLDIYSVRHPKCIDCWIISVPHQGFHSPSVLLFLYCCRVKGLPLGRSWWRTQNTQPFRRTAPNSYSKATRSVLYCFLDQLLTMLSYHGILCIGVHIY